MPLAVEIGGNTSGFEQAMAKAQATAALTATEVTRRFGNAAEAITTSWAISAAKFAILPAAAIAGAVLGFKLIGDAADQAAARLEELVEIGEKSRGAGVSSDFLQRFRDNADALNTTMPKLMEMLDKAREASTVKIGEGGEAATSAVLKRLDEHVKAGNVAKEIVESFRGLADQESRIRAMLDLLDQLQSQGKNLAAFDLAKAFFPGTDFETKLRNGEDIIKRMRDALDGVGKVQFNDELLADAKQIKEQLEQAERTMRDGWLPIQQDIARWQQQQLASWADIKTNIASVVELIGKAYTFLTGWTDEITKIGNNPIWRTIANALPRTGTGVEDAPPGGFVPLPPIRPNITAPGDLSKSLPAKPKKETDDAKAALERYTEQLTKANAEAQTQAEFVGKTNAEYQTALVLARARVAAERDFKDELRKSKNLTEEEVASLTHLAEVMEKAKTAAKQFGELQSFAGHLLVDSLMKATEAGAKFSDIMADVAKSIARAALQALILGQGPLAGLFQTGTAQSGQVGGLFGQLWNALPKFQEGGIVPGTGPRLAVVHGGETIIPPKIAGSAQAGGGVTISISQPVDARGAQMGVADQIAAALDANNRAIRVQLPAMIRDARSRSSL